MTIAVQRTERSNFPTHIYACHRKASEDAEADSRLSQWQSVGLEKSPQPLTQTASTAVEFGDEGLSDLSVHRQTQEMRCQAAFTSQTALKKSGPFSGPAQFFPLWQGGKTGADCYKM
jgi:hypothetical protein